MPLAALLDLPLACAAVRARSETSWEPAAAAWTLDEPPAPTKDGGDPAGMAALERLVRDSTSDDELSRRAAVWGVLVAVTGRFPTVQECDDAETALLTDDLGSFATSLTAGDHRTEELAIRVVDGIVVDVTRTATSDGDAGIPRVVRELVRRWGAVPGVTYATWDAGRLRSLTATEFARLGLPPDPGPPVVLLPLGATVVVTEVLRPATHAEAFEAMARAGVVRLTALGYDLAGLVEPHPDVTNGPFVHHLAALTHADLVVTISEAVRRDFDDYFSIAARSGRSRPEVVALVLPEGLPVSEPAATPQTLESLRCRVLGDPTWPILTTVASLHRRKNHLALLRACERLWRDGVHFRLLVVESGGAVRSAMTAMDRLAERGRPITRLRGASDSELDAAYRIARASAYVSLAEGFGLPIAESLACGTPVVASSVGSMGELAAAGGVVTVDPRDGASVEVGLRAVLTDDTLHASLVAAALARPSRGWPEYASELGALLGVTGPQSDEPIDASTHQEDR